VPTTWLLYVCYFRSVRRAGRVSEADAVGGCQATNQRRTEEALGGGEGGRREEALGHAHTARCQLLLSEGLLSSSQCRSRFR
jgi:hypothetical protein